LKLEEWESLEMPECDAMHLVSYLYEIGPTLPNGMGDAPLTHLEIEAWQRNTGIELSSWEARVLHSSSLAYLSESQRATKPDAEAPWAEAPYLRPPIDEVALRLQRSMLELCNL
jgi:hypothetical protein